MSLFNLQQSAPRSPHTGICPSSDLPERLSQGTTLKAKYTYMADGTKVSALDASGAGLVYRGPFTYRRSSGGTLAFESAPFERGRLTEAGVRYHVTDHLGSVRAVIDGNASTTTYPLAGFYSVDDFAPFGTKSTSSASSYLSLASTGSTVSLRDGFTGQEDQSPDFGVGYSDFGARQYSPTLSRWLVPDPLGEKYYDVSPYAYCAGNPVSLVDPTGEDWFVSDDHQFRWFNSSSKEYWEDNIRYSWVGESISFQQEDGSFLNFYQNYQIGDATSKPQNAERLILDNPALTGFLLGRNSCLPDYAKSNLMMAAIHNGQNDFLTHPITIGAAIGVTGFLLATEGASLYLANKIGPPLTRVFWSGNLRNEAMQFAIESQMTTLEMTRIGRSLEWLTNNTSYKLTEPLCKAASRMYAGGAQGTAYALLRKGLKEGVGIWNTIEKPILVKNGVHIITLTIP